MKRTTIRTTALNLADPPLDSLYNCRPGALTFAFGQCFEQRMYTTDIDVYDIPWLKKDWLTHSLSTQCKERG
jgi:hypothetical protein